MAQQLSQGGNCPLAPGGGASIAVSWDSSPSDLDVACFVLKADGKVASDDWMVFYNQPQAPGNVVKLAGGANAVTFRIQLDALPATVERCCFTATLDGASTVAEIKGLTLRASAGGTELVFNPVGLGAEKALMVAELYRHSSGWKVRAVAQGFNGGLAPLARHFGVTVEEDAGRAPPPAPAVKPAPAPAPAPTPGPTVNLRKITLDKPTQSTPIQLAKKADGRIEHIAVQMRWTKAVDLDLHAFYRMKSGAEGHVYFVEKGNLHGVPYIMLDRDMGVGNVAGKNVENLRISNIDQLESVLFVANIFRFFGGSKENFAKYDGEVSVSTSLGEIVVPLTSDTPGKWAVIAKLENRDQPRLININRITKDEPKLADF